jgi:TPR repeat protein
MKEAAMMRKHFIYLLFAAVLTLAPVAALAAECTRFGAFWPKEESITTESGELIWRSKHMSPREYVEFLESKGGPFALCIFAGLYFEGKEYPQGYKKAAEILLGNDIRFCTPNFVYLGAMFKNGLGVAKNPAKAEYWFRAYFAASSDPAANSEDMTGIIEDIHSSAGVRIKVDYDAAQAWVDKAFDEPPERLYEMGLAYLKTGEAGAGFPLADAMLRRAALAGHEKAALTHARLYLDCKIGAYGQPRSYLPRFAKAGHAEAAALLGLYYAENPRKEFFTYRIAKRLWTKHWWATFLSASGERPRRRWPG